MTPQKFDTGSAVHKGLEAYYLGTSYLTAIDDYWNSIQDQLGPEADIDKWIAELVTLPNLIVEGYIEWVADEGIDIGDELLGLEIPLEAKIGERDGEDVVLYGTIDRLIRNSDGQLIVDDFKTVATLGPVTTLATNYQINNYGLLVRANYGEMPHQGRHTQLKRSKRTARAKPPFYGRCKTTFNETKMQSHWLNLDGVVKDMLDVLGRLDSGANHGIAYPNPTLNCSWDCPFDSICPMMDDGSDWEFALETDFRQREES